MFGRFERAVAQYNKGITVGKLNLCFCCVRQLWSDVNLPSTIIISSSISLRPDYYPRVPLVPLKLSRQTKFIGRENTSLFKAIQKFGAECSVAALQTTVS